ncbi:MAG: type II secretion system protein GspD [bacterium]|nr:MAG: type II secretion system protein GspD [bacterium]
MRRLLIGLLPIAFLVHDAVGESISISGAVSKTPVSLMESDSGRLPGPKINVVRKIGKERKIGLQTEKSQKKQKPAGKFKVVPRTMVLNFENAPIREVIKNICELLNINYIIEPGVKGYVTIRTLDKIPVSSALELLDQLLVINNLTRVKIGDYWRFLPTLKALKEPLPIYRNVPANRFAAQDRYQIRILSFNYVSARKVLEILKPFLSANASARVLGRSNMVMLVERGTKLLEIENLVKAIDIDTLDTMQVKLFELRNGLAVDVNSELTLIFDAMGYIKNQPGEGITFLPLERFNAILMINPFPNLYASISSWVEKLDSDPVQTAGVSTFIYRVQNGDAATLADILRQLYVPERKETDQRRGIAVQNILAGQEKKTGTEKQGKPHGKDTVSEIAASPMEGTVLIIPHKETNSIIVRTAKKNYSTILGTLEKLDAMPLQVLIEVLITELTLSDDLELGFEWALKKGTYTLSQNLGGLGQAGTVRPNLEDSSFNSVGETGLSFFTRPTDDVMGLIHALASESRLDVRASPILMTSDNKAASIDITNEIPIPIITRSSTGLDTETIQYRSVGIRLSVTPKINDKRFVTLEIDQEISQIDDSRADQFENAVPLLRRQAKTTVVIKDRQTLIIGGMINEQSGKGKSGVPFLSKIPILGWLFGVNTKTTRKTELLILITPHVVSNDMEARAITQQYQKQIREMQMSVKSVKSKKGKKEKEKTLME